MSLEHLKKHPKPRAPQSVKFSCGHEKQLDQLLQSKCPACKEQKRQAERAKSKEAFARKRAEKAEASKTLADSGRLPDGSQKVLTWDKGQWFGTLTVPRDGICYGFVCNADSEKKCFHGLDAAYRKWLGSTPDEQAIYRWQKE